MKFNVLVFAIGVVLLVVGTYSIHRIVFAGTRYYSFESKDFIFWSNVIIVYVCVGVGIFGAFLLPEEIKSFNNIKELIEAGLICIGAIAGVIFLLDFFKPPHQDPIDPLTKSVIVSGMICLFVAIHGRLFHMLGLVSEKQTVASHLERAMTLNSEKNYAEGAKEAVKAIKLNPKSALAHSVLGRALVNMGELSEAAQEYRKAVQLEPDESFYHYSLACVLMSMEEYEEAVEEASVAAELKPDEEVCQKLLREAKNALNLHRK